MCVYSQGIRGVTTYVDGKKPMSADKALSSMSDIYDSRDAAATSCHVASTYGSHYKLIQIRNLSGSTQFITVVNDNTGNTCHYAIPAYQATGKITPARSIASGAVIDSTGYDFQYE
jgi:hypothetical protein